MQELQDDLQQILQLRRRTAEYQLACYPPNGAQYVKHRDALPDDGADLMQRKVLCLLPSFHSIFRPFLFSLITSDYVPSLVTCDDTFV